VNASEVNNIIIKVIATIV